MIIAHNYGKFPEGISYSYGNPGELSEYDIEDLEKRLGIEEIQYWYSPGDYEGMGEILMRKGDLFDIHDASHCSCYGPTERADFHGVPLKELVRGCTMDRLSEIKPLINMVIFRY